MHSVILEEHTKTLDKHSVILEEHTKTLDKHSEILKKHTGLIEGNSFEIRRNGVLMEELQHAMELVVEGNVNNYEKTQRFEVRFEAGEPEKIPVLWERVKDHSKRIKKIEAKIS